MISKCLKLGLLLVGVLALSVLPAYAVPYAYVDMTTVTLGASVAPTLTDSYIGGKNGKLQGTTVSDVYFNAATAVYTYVYKVTPFSNGGGTFFGGVHTSTSIPRPLGLLETSADLPAAPPVVASDFNDLHVDHLSVADGGTGAEGQSGIGWRQTSVGGGDSVKEHDAGFPQTPCTAGSCPLLRGQTDLLGQNVFFVGWTEDVAAPDAFFGFLGSGHWNSPLAGGPFSWWDTGEMVSVFWQSKFGNPILGELNYDWLGANSGFSNNNGTTFIYVPGSPVPEPGTLVLMATGLGLLGVAGARARRKKVA